MTRSLLPMAWKIQYVNESYETPETQHDNDDTNVITNDATSINNEKRPETTPQNQHSSTKLLKFNHHPRRQIQQFVAC